MKKVLYVFDNINYESGAQKATLYQMECLSHLYDIHALSLIKPSDQMKVPGKILEIYNLWEDADIYADSFKHVLTSNVSILKKLLRVFYALSMRAGKAESFLDHFLYGTLSKKLETFDVVIVVSEASKLRGLVGKLQNPRKIQWIHTDYELWSQFSAWTKSVTQNDDVLYQPYDQIVALTEHSKEGMLRKLPALIDKVAVIPNMINAKAISEKAQEKTSIILQQRKYRFVTVGRIDREKNFDRVLEFCEHLCKDGVDYCWYIIGAGPLEGYIRKKIKEKNLTDQVIMLGQLTNPYPVMCQADYFVLLSDYEGTPVTIDEAMVLNVPVIATAVGGIPEQLKKYGSGTVLTIDENMYEEFKQAVVEGMVTSTTSIEKVNGGILEKLERLIQ